MFLSQSEINLPCSACDIKIVVMSETHSGNEQSSVPDMDLLFVSSHQMSPLKSQSLCRENMKS